MTSPGGKLAALVCLMTKKVNKAQLLSYIGQTVLETSYGSLNILTNKSLFNCFLKFGKMAVAKTTLGKMFSRHKNRLHSGQLLQQI
jgi:hypothetical protein